MYCDSRSVQKSGRRFCLAALVLLLGGCPGEKPPAPMDETAAELPFAGTTVRLLIAGDPELAEVVRKLAGEWRTRTGAELQVSECEPATLATSDRPAADAVICPSADLPSLAQHGGVAPLSRDILTSKQLPWLDILPNVRNDEAAWKGRPTAVPLGSPVLVCYYRADILRQAGLHPPQTWSEYQTVCEKLAQK